MLLMNNFYTDLVGKWGAWTGSLPGGVLRDSAQILINKQTNHMKKILLLAVAAAILATVSARAQIKVNDSLSVTGWAVSSYQYTKPQPGNSVDSFNLDAALLSAVLTPTKGITATFSLYYRPSSEGGVSPSGSEVTLLDAYISYDAGGGVTLTAGKFLSYLGYESFYQISDNMITLANQQFLAPIPGYHEGIKLDYAPNKTTTMGVALADSLYQKPGYNATEGDSNLRDGPGAEAYFQYTGVTDVTIWAGVGYQGKSLPGFNTGEVVDLNGKPVTVWDLWISYQVTKASTLALEEIYKDGGADNKGSNWLAYYQYNFTDKFSSWFGVSGEKVSNNVLDLTETDGYNYAPAYAGASYVKYSISPNYAITANLSVRAQYSYTKYHDYAPATSANFVGVEMLFKF